MSPGEWVSASAAPGDSVARLMGVWAVISCVAAASIVLAAISILALRLRRMERHLEQILEVVKCPGHAPPAADGQESSGREPRGVGFDCDPCAASTD